MTYQSKYLKYKKKYFNLLGSAQLLRNNDIIQSSETMKESPILTASRPEEYLKIYGLLSCLGILIYLTDDKNIIQTIIGFHYGGDTKGNKSENLKDKSKVKKIIESIKKKEKETLNITLYIYKDREASRNQIQNNLEQLQQILQPYPYLFNNIYDIHNTNQYLINTPETNMIISQKVGRPFQNPITKYIPPSIKKRLGPIPPELKRLEEQTLNILKPYQDTTQNYPEDTSQEDYPKDTSQEDNYPRENSSTENDYPGEDTDEDYPDFSEPETDEDYPDFSEPETEEDYPDFSEPETEEDYPDFSEPETEEDYPVDLPDSTWDRKRKAIYSCRLGERGVRDIPITRENCNRQIARGFGQSRCSLTKNGVCRKRQSASKKRGIRHWNKLREGSRKSNFETEN